MTRRSRPRAPRRARTTGKLVVDGRIVAPAEVATGALERARGLLGREGIDGVLILEHTRQVHTFRMRFAIDVAHVDRHGSVLHIATMPTNRLGRFVARSRRIIEAEAGAFANWGLTPGSVIEFRAEDD